MRSGSRTAGGGEFQPLSYYEKLGYDVSMIERNTLPQDKRFNPQLGHCYRVHVQGSKDAKTDELERKSILEAIKDNKAIKDKEKKERAAAQLVLENAPAKAESTKDESSSSSSS